MKIYPVDKRLEFREGDEALSFLPILLGVLRANNKNKPVRMAHRDGVLSVTCYSMTNEEWNSSVNDIKAWAQLLNIWSKLYKEGK